MHIKLIVAGAAIALAVGLGSASAGEKFATLDGVPAEPMDAAALANTIGSHMTINPFGSGKTTGVTGISHKADGGPNENKGVDIASGGGKKNRGANVQTNTF
jgi:hypothetical protein